jgi:hypothetical protein
MVAVQITTVSGVGHRWRKRYESEHQRNRNADLDPSGHKNLLYLKPGYGNKNAASLGSAAAMEFLEQSANDMRRNEKNCTITL